jgi:hypothetical protein
MRSSLKHMGHGPSASVNFTLEKQFFIGVSFFRDVAEPHFDFQFFDEVPHYF